MTKNTYKIIRFRMNHDNKVIKRGLTLDEAQKHCRSTETSSSTCITIQARAYTEIWGPWFDGYDEE